MWRKALNRFLQRLVVEGKITVTWPDGTSTVYGSDGWLSASITLRDEPLLRALALQPELALGEGYMDGRVRISPEDLRNLLLILVHNRRDGVFPLWVRMVEAVRFRLRNVLLRNSPRSARRNVAHHYDLSDELYDLFLDADKQYSCAYFHGAGLSLEEAQLAKKRLIGRKLLIEPGMRVLDIGCGWGGMALTLAQEFGAQVTGITLSENQLATAQARAKAAGLDGQVTFALQDYRTLEDQFDRIVSIGMLEHVGTPHFGTYFQKVHDLLAPDGVALIHTIGRCTPPTAQSKWLNKYIFPGGYVPSMSELSTAIEPTGLWVADMEVWRKHYADTLAEWRRRFEAKRAQVETMYDARFVRMWRFYLLACEAAFLEHRQGVFHLQLSHKLMTVPNTRDYLYRGDAPLVQHAAQ